MNGQLNEHLYQTETEAKNQVEHIVEDLAKERGIDEELKSLDQLRWVAEMNNCKACAEETVMREIIFAWFFRRVNDKQIVQNRRTIDNVLDVVPSKRRITWEPID